MASQQVNEYMMTINGGGDPVTALAYRPFTPEESRAARHAEVKRVLHENLEKLSGRATWGGNILVAQY